MIKTYVKFSTAFMLALGSLVPLTMPSQAGSLVCVDASDSVRRCETIADNGAIIPEPDASPYPLNKTYNAETQTVCADNIAGRSPTLPATANVIVCGPIADFALGAPAVNTSGLPRLDDSSKLRTVLLSFFLFAFH